MSDEILSEDEIEVIHTNMIPYFVKFLKKYNSSEEKTKKIKKDAAIRLDRYINILIKCLTIDLCLVLNSTGHKIIQERHISQVLDLMLRGIDIREFLDGKKFDTAYKNRFSNELYTESQESEFYKLYTTEKTFDRIMDRPVHKLMQKIAHEHDKSICDISLNVTITLVNLILSYILDNTPDTITCESLTELASKDDFSVLDTQLCGFNILGCDVIA